MTDRRKFLAGLGAGAAVAGVAVLREPPDEPVAVAPTVADCFPPKGLRKFPLGVEVLTHFGGRARFYEDLVRGRNVLIHFFSLQSEPEVKSLAKMAEVQERLGDRLGRDVFIRSITVDPARDTVAALEAFTAPLAPRGGWDVLTGGEAELQSLRSALFYTAVGTGKHDHHDQDCSLGLIRYGNEAAGLWGACPLRTSPSWIVKRVGWILPRPPADGPVRRAGPPAVFA